MPSAVFLIGFMGAGKTTFGKKLAAKLKRTFIDLDDAVCKRYEVESVKALIEQKGIDFFREAESKTLRSLNADGSVVSTGGGTPCYFDSLAWMKENGAVVYLQVDEKTLFNRLKQTDLNERPLLKDLDDEGLRKFIEEKLKERLPYYEQAHIVFNPVQQRMEELCLQLEE